MAEQLTTERVLLRSWRPEDAEAALGVYGAAEVARWLSPAMDRVHDVSAMRLLLQQWAAEDSRLIPPASRWAIESREDKRLIGGAILLPLPPGGEDLEMGWQLHPAAWGQGYATEAGRALAAWAFSQGIDELLAVVRPANRRAEATARRIGMQWVGETEKYYDLRLQVFRLRPTDLHPDPDPVAEGDPPFNGRSGLRPLRFGRLRPAMTTATPTQQGRPSALGATPGREHDRLTVEWRYRPAATRARS